MDGEYWQNEQNGFKLEKDKLCQSATGFVHFQDFLISDVPNVSHIKNGHKGILMDFVQFPSISPIR